MVAAPVYEGRSRLALKRFQPEMTIFVQLPAAIAKRSLSDIQKGAAIRSLCNQRMSREPAPGD
jgi:hypothetical protein